MNTNYLAGMSCPNLPRAVPIPLAMPAVSHNFRRGLRRRWHRASSLLSLWRQRWHGRYELAAMNDRELRDLGVKRSDVLRETAKPFWRA